jgi:hypothetical protein
VYSKQVKLFSATVGASALLAMGAFAIASNDVSAAQDPPLPPGPVTTSEITTGETVTDTGAPASPETSVVTPPITTPPSTIPTGEPQ